MERRKLVWSGAALAVLLLLYVVSFGPLVYLVTRAERSGFFPRWMGTPLTIAVYPHLWACYHHEGYFTYVRWFFNDGAMTFTWQDFREKHTGKFSE